MLGTSAATPGNNQLPREFKDEDTKKHALKSSTKTLRGPDDKRGSSRLKLRGIHNVLSFK